MINIKNASLVFGSLLVLLVCWKVGSYFFDTSEPEISMSALLENQYCSGDVQTGIMSNKKGVLTVTLDGQLLVENFFIKNVDTDNAFVIPTCGLSNGPHHLKLEFVDNSYNKNKTSLTRVFNVDNLRLQAAFTKNDGDYKVLQGRTLHIQFQVNKPIKEAKVTILSQSYPCFPENIGSTIYECYIPIDCDENPNEYLYTIDIVDNVGNVLSLENKFQVVMYPFKSQTLQVTQEKLDEEASLDIPSYESLKIILEDLTKQSPRKKMWRSVFCTPIDIVRVSCDFGTIRTTQERGRYKHKALDVLSKPKGVIWATNDGIVVLKRRFKGSGNTVVIDHGWGVLSLFYHLDDFADIQEGQFIKQGMPIGTLGKTGYATGYHLHWEMRVNNIAVDPMQWVRPMF